MAKLSLRTNNQISTQITRPLLRVYRELESCHSLTPQRTPKKYTNLSPISKYSYGSIDDAAECTMEYLAMLLKEKKQLDLFPQVFENVSRLIDDEIHRVRSVLFHCHFAIEKKDLPGPIGDPIMIQEKIYVPRKEHPDYNFVGRILGPRGMTAKQLERETGCKIMVRGRGSMRDRAKEEANRGRPSWEHLDDELHVLIQCEDTPNRVYTKLKAGVDQIKKLLIPAPEGTDELKRKQLMELALINGTYRPVNKYPLHAPRLLTPMTIVSPMRHATSSAIAAQPIFVSPGSPISPIPNAQSSVGTFLHSPNVDYSMIMNQLSFDAALTPFSMTSDYQTHSTSFPTTATLINAAIGSPSAISSCFIDSHLITPPNSAGSAQNN